MSNTNMKIVADSSADVMSLERVPFDFAPLKIITDEKEYVDNAELNVSEMVQDLSKYTGKSGSACPSEGDWLAAFGDAQYVFCVTITSGLSGSYNSARIAKSTYEESHPDRKVFLIDSLSAGPELKLIIEKLEELILAGKSYDAICFEITEYRKHADLMFVLESLQSLANNGRVSPLVAKAVGILGIRIVGKASEQGTLEQLSKCRGAQKGLAMLFQHMTKFGYNGGKVRIGHCLNLDCARNLRDMIKAKFPAASIEIFSLRGLCSYYAEKGGLLVGFEK